MEEKTEITVLENGEVSVTFKGPGGYNDRWVVVRYPTPEAALAATKTPVFKELLDHTWKISQYDAAREAAKPVPNQAAPRGGTPQQVSEAPGGEKRFCQHGEMVFKTGVAKNTGKPYSLFSCTAPRDQQCQAQFLK